MRSDCRTRVVWAAFRERNFEVGEPFSRARSVPSKYCFFRTYASASRIFFIKSHNLSLFAPFFRFFLQLAPRAFYQLSSTGLCPIYSEANYHLQLALRAIYYLPLLFRYQLRYIYDRYTIDIRQIHDRLPYSHRRNTVSIKYFHYFTLKLQFSLQKLANLQNFYYLCTIIIQNS